MATQWMQCKVFKSTFGNERVIELEDRDFVVPTDKVKGEPGGEGLVQVKVFNRPDGTWAEIPSANSTSVPVKDPNLLIQENNMSRLFYINEKERGIGKSYALAKFCAINILMHSINDIVVLAATFRQSKIVLNYIHDVLNKMKIFHNIDRRVDQIIITLSDDSQIACFPINDHIYHSPDIIVLDEHSSIPEFNIEELTIAHGPCIDIREHNFFELKGQEHACV